MPNLADGVPEVAGLGGWELDVATGRVSWTPETFRLHELVAVDAPPLQEALDFYPAETRPMVQRAVEAAIEEGTPYDLETPFVTARGRRLWVRSWGRPVREGGRTVRLRGAYQDVTARHEAEDRAHDAALARERAETLLRDVLDALPSAVTAYDRDERLILVNRAYREAFPVLAGLAEAGQTLEEVLRLAAERRQFVDVPADAAGREAWVAMHLKLRRAADGSARLLRPADGRTVQIVEHLSPAGNLVSVRTDVTDLVRAEALLRDVLDALPCAVVAYDREERLVLTNRAYHELAPISGRFAVPGRRLEEMIELAAEHGQYVEVPSSPAERRIWIDEHLALHRVADGTPRNLKLAGGRFMQVRDRRSEDGNLVSVRADITDLIRAEALLRDVLETLSSGVTAYDADERFILFNSAYAEMFPISSRFAVPGRRREDVLRLIAEHGQHTDSGSTAAEREAWVARHLAAHRAPGQARTLHLVDGRVVQVRDRRSETGNVVSVNTDTTDLVRAEANLRILAETDSLTGLANRSAFLASLEGALKVGGSGGALLLIDVDYFKQVNDTLGHDMGDVLLTEIGARLRMQSRASDVAARLGGDEFGLMLAGLTDAKILAARVDDLHAALSAPVALAGRLAPIGISAGLAVFDGTGVDAASLLKSADLALYDAKRKGRGRWSAFHPKQAEALAQHVRMSDALRAALAGHALTIALQPKRLLRGGHDGFEALARWHDGVRWVSPQQFIEVAESTGLIVQLGRVVMQQAVGRLRQLRDLGFEPGRVAVNVTGPQLLDPSFLPETLATLRLHGLQPADLEMELTETVLLGRAADRIEAGIRAFSERGVTIALDDFGTGCASLASLSRLPIDRLKIDRSFVAGIGKGGPGGVIARSVISLAHGLGIEVIAEGIETREQLAFLEAAGCDSGQGYLFSRPLLTTAEAEAYLAAQGAVLKGPAQPVAASGR